MLISFFKILPRVKTTDEIKKGQYSNTGKKRLSCWKSGAHFNIKTTFLSLYMDSHYKDKIVLRPSYLYNGNSYTSMMICVYPAGIQPGGG